MKWYLVKIVYRIICGEGLHTPQFDEQLRMVRASDALQAFLKGRLLGEHGEETFLNDRQDPVKWKFIDVSELYLIDEIKDGAEIYTRVQEEVDVEAYLDNIRRRANRLYAQCLDQSKIVA
ncbi:MAG: DUF4288 domain-containing protein [Chitinophagaceae bacterium]|nr:DUF4288 domain-containing protein [Chitinophagaceae bacterium]